MLSLKQRSLCVISYFTKLHQDYLQYSFFKTIVNKHIKLTLYNLLDISKKNKIPNDQKPYGHNKGMLLGFDIINYIFQNIKYRNDQTIIIHPTPSGYLLNKDIVQQLCRYNNFIFICSRYEGIDARIIKKYNVFEISIGDYILFDGDTTAIVIYNAIIRNIFVKQEAKIEESLENNLLEYEQFTKPVLIEHMLVPCILRGGHHSKIQQWKLHNSILRTITKRPDLYSKYIK